MKVEAQLLPINPSGLRRLLQKNVVSLEPENDIKPREVFRGFWIQPEWGVSAVCFSGGGIFALIEDGTKLLQEMIENGDIMYRSWTDQTQKKSNTWGSFKPPETLGNTANPSSHWHTQVKKSQRGLTIVNIVSKEQLELSITW